LIKSTLERLFQGPRKAGLINPFPEGIKVLGVNLKNGTLEINFDKNLEELYPRGSSSENMFIYSIVNTVTNFPQVKKVRFLIDGKAREIIGSNYDFSTQDFSRDESLIAR
jgi:spore germination protein GerM